MFIDYARKGSVASDTSGTTVDSVELGGVGGKPISTVERVKGFMKSPVDSESCNTLALYACFLTGWTSAVSFSVSAWCACQ
jgi:hypothetical protein